MTYFNFLLYFVILPAAVLTWIVRPTRREWLVLAAMLAITYVWTTPWDNYLVGSGVWYYDPALVSGVVIGWVPLEEYLFFGLQVWLSGTLTFGLMRLFAARSTAFAPGAALPALMLPLALAFSPTPPLPGSGLPAGTPASDLPALPFGEWNYLFLILAWALPVIAGQWAIGWDAFLANWKVYTLGIVIPAVYLTTMDSIAIGSGTWTIAATQSLGVFLPGGVPVEEGVFFLATNVLIVQGVLLFTSPAVEARLRRWVKR